MCTRLYHYDPEKFWEKCRCGKSVQFLEKLYIPVINLWSLQDRIPMSSVIGSGEWNIGKALWEKATPHFFCIYLELLEVWEILDSSWKINDMGEQMGEEEISWNLSTVINKEKSRKNFSHQSNEGISIDNLWDYFLLMSPPWGKAFHRNNTVLARRVFQRDFTVVDKIKLSKKLLKSRGILNVVRKQK